MRMFFDYPNNCLVVCTNIGSTTFTTAHCACPSNSSGMISSLFVKFEIFIKQIHPAAQRVFHESH